MFAMLIGMLAPTVGEKWAKPAAIGLLIALAADDLKAAVEPKPVPGEDIATSDQANADYSASVEAWGDRISAAGGRICRWSERVYKIRIGCPK
jgi:hypothetical protein